MLYKKTQYKCCLKIAKKIEPPDQRREKKSSIRRQIVTYASFCCSFGKWASRLREDAVKLAI